MSEILISLLSGGATGLLGTAISGVLGFAKKGQDHKHSVKMREYDLKELEMELNSAEKIAVLSAEKSALEGSYKDASTFITSGMELTAGQKWIAILIDLVRGLMRPMITIFFLGVTAYFAWIGGITGDVEQTVLYLTSTTVSWWFGTRQVEKHAGAAK